MDTELRYFLEQGAHTVKDLARLTGKSTSTIYKNLKGIDGVIEEDGPQGKRFSRPITVKQETAKTPAATAPAPLSETSKRGRKATAAGQKLHPGLQLLAAGEVPQDKGNHYVNPRRQGSHGYRSLAIIIDNPGITTEDYLAQGGRLNDLRWDIAHGNVKVEG